MTTTRKPAPGLKTVHAYSHRCSKVTVKHVTPHHHTLSPEKRTALLYSQDQM